jgi:hypothetical protein
MIKYKLSFDSVTMLAQFIGKQTYIEIILIINLQIFFE